MTQPTPANQQNSTAQRTVLLATDRSQSIIAETVEDETNTIAYSAYGDRSAQHEAATGLGFNGQLREKQTSWYLLGNGYRAYNPRLMRFHSPDSWSPFSGGGLNAYMYCVGDPVNRSDPTGHAPLFPGLPQGLRKFVSRVDRFFFAGPEVTGPSRRLVVQRKALGEMRPEKTGELKALIGAGTIVGGARGPRGNRSPAIQYVETKPKIHPGYVDGAFAGGLTQKGNSPRASSNHGGSVGGISGATSTGNGGKGMPLWSMDTVAAAQQPHAYAAYPIGTGSPHPRPGPVQRGDTSSSSVLPPSSARIGSATHASVDRPTAAVAAIRRNTPPAPPRSRSSSFGSFDNSGPSDWSDG